MRRNTVQKDNEQKFLFPPYLPIPHFQEDVHLVVMDAIMMMIGCRRRRGGGGGHRRRVAVCRDDKSSHDYNGLELLSFLFAFTGWITVLAVVLTVACDLERAGSRHLAKRNAKSICIALPCYLALLGRTNEGSCRQFLPPVSPNLKKCPEALMN